MIVKDYTFSIEENKAYLIEANGHAILIDAPSEEIDDILKKEQIKLDYVFLTHEHCDHLWGLNLIREKYNPKIIASSETSKGIQNAKINRAAVHHIYITMRYGSEASCNCTPDRKLTCKAADIVFEEKLSIKWQGKKMVFVHTPGHSKGSSMMLLDKMLFSGDTLLRNEEVFTRFENGSIDDYEKVTLPYLQSLNKDILVCPGHGERFLLSEINFE